MLSGVSRNKIRRVGGNPGWWESGRFLERLIFKLSGRGSEWEKMELKEWGGTPSTPNEELDHVEKRTSDPLGWNQIVEVKACDNPPPTLLPLTRGPGLIRIRTREVFRILTHFQAVNFQFLYLEPLGRSTRPHFTAVLYGSGGRNN